jgi:hypothetical protein
MRGDTKNSSIKVVAVTGLIAKGVVYCLLGILAFMAAFEIAGQSDNNTDKKGVFQFIQNHAGGKVMLALIALGLLCYSIWRGIQTFGNTENKDNNAKGISSRVRYLFSGAVYLAVAFVAAKTLFDKDKGNGDANQTFVAELLSKPLGQWMAALVALSIAGVGVYQAYYGLSEKYKKHVSELNVHNNASHYLLTAGKIGYVSRGVVWLIIAFLMMKAALHANSKEAGDTGKAFQFLESSSYGSYMLGALGVGLVLYGVFNVVRARYERF